MEVIIYDEKGFEAPLIHDIIGESIDEGDNLMLKYTEKGVAMLYATIKNDVFIKLSKNEPVNEPIDFFEYSAGKAKKGYIAVVARVNIENIFDTLIPYSHRQLEDYKAQCIRDNLHFKNENELIVAYMKTHRLQVLRCCMPSNSCMGTTYVLKYRVFDEKCILSCNGV